MNIFNYDWQKLSSSFHMLGFILRFLNCCSLPLWVQGRTFPTLASLFLRSSWLHSLLFSDVGHQMLCLSGKEFWFSVGFETLDSFFWVCTYVWVCVHFLYSFFVCCCSLMVSKHDAMMFMRAFKFTCTSFIARWHLRLMKEKNIIYLINIWIEAMI